MDDASFALNGPLRVLHQAGIRYLFTQQESASAPALSCEAPAVSPTPENALGPAEEKPVVLPAAWQGFLAKVPGAASVVFSYPDLYLDLSGQSSQQRSNLWRSIIPALGLPKGAVCFWPYTELSGGDLHVQLDYFLTGLQLIRPSHIVLFGVEPNLRLPQSISDLPALQRCPLCLEAPSPESLMEYPNESLTEFLSRLRNFTHS